MAAQRRVRSSMGQDMTDAAAAPDIIDQHVDLFITIKDDTDEAQLIENLRSEPGSFGSRLSIHSGTQNSPDDPGNPPTIIGGNSMGNLPLPNNPTNASTYSSAARDKTPQRSASVQASMSKRGSPGGATALTHGKSVDLVVDISRGGLPQVRSEPSKNDSPGNGMQLVPIGSNYMKMTNNDESSL